VHVSCELQGRESAQPPTGCEGAWAQKLTLSLVAGEGGSEQNVTLLSVEPSLDVSILAL
jgi:hypothetical protein